MNNSKFLSYQHYYLVGIKGVAMTGLAQILIDAGKTVRGSDTGETFITDGVLSRLQIDVDTDFDQQLPPETECVIFTGAHGGSKNPQVLAAQQQSVPTLTHAQAQGELSQVKKTIAVCGVGGKSTISAMIAWILEKTNHRPSYSVGVGEISGLGRNAAWNTDSDLFVVEADEYTEDPSVKNDDGSFIPRFKYLKPSIVICSNISFDHPDVYQSPEHTLDTFEQFFRQIEPQGILITHNKVVAQIPDHVQHLQYGTEGDLTYEAHFQGTGTNSADVVLRDQSASLTLQVPGEHNMENAAGAIIACAQLGISVAEATAALAEFQSTTRRFEKKGVYRDALLYDDYAHHPREVAVVIQALTDFFPQKRTILAFQPHTYSRTEALFDDFVQVLSKVENLVLLDIFGSAREKTSESKISSEQLANAIQQKNPTASVTHLPGVPELVHYCATTLRNEDVFVTLGAGDIYTVHELLLKKNNI